MYSPRFSRFLRSVGVSAPTSCLSASSFRNSFHNDRRTYSYLPKEQAEWRRGCSVRKKNGDGGDDCVDETRWGGKSSCFFHSRLVLVVLPSDTNLFVQQREKRFASLCFSPFYQLNSLSLSGSTCIDYTVIYRAQAAISIYTARFVSRPRMRCILYCGCCLSQSPYIPFPAIAHPRSASIAVSSQHRSLCARYAAAFLSGYTERNRDGNTSFSSFSVIIILFLL